MMLPLLAAFFAVLCVAEPPASSGGAGMATEGDALRPEVPPPPFTEGIFPCSDCHADLEVNRARRVLTDFHDDIELRHDEQHRWCLDCHDAVERDSLHLASGERIGFGESYRLCGQCHGEKLRDWRVGVHGRRTGDWNGRKQYLLCAHCHNPHRPRFQSLAPMPRPRASDEIGRVERTVPMQSGDSGSIDVTRRRFLSLTAAAAAGGVLGSCAPRRLHEFSADRLKVLLRDLEQRYSTEMGVDVKLGNAPAMPGVLFAYALDISRCVGCRRCVYSCAEENNLSRDPQVHWIRVLSMEKEKGVDLAHADPYYSPAGVPEEGRFYFPVACQQCRNAPCTKVCPTGATWTESDGIVVIDYDWCIGCRYCMAACPYGARHFNWAAPSIPRSEVNTDMHVLGNRPRPKGVVEKCTFCIQRTRAGRYPACVEVCPVGARKFGNLLDPESEIRYIIEHKRVLVFKEDLNTVPKFFYFYAT